MRCYSTHITYGKEANETILFQTVSLNSGQFGLFCSNVLPWAGEQVLIPFLPPKAVFTS